MKSILIDEKLHRRLKTYTQKKNLLLGKYVEYCINIMLTADELSIDDEYLALNERITYFMGKAKDEGAEIVFKSEEYEQYMVEVNNFWNKKKLEDNE